MPAPSSASILQQLAVNPYRLNHNELIFCWGILFLCSPETTNLWWLTLQCIPGSVNPYQHSAWIRELTNQSDKILHVSSDLNEHFPLCASSCGCGLETYGLSHCFFKFFYIQCDCLLHVQFCSVLISHMLN